MFEKTLSAAIDVNAAELGFTAAVLKDDTVFVHQPGADCAIHLTCAGFFRVWL